MSIDQIAAPPKRWTWGALEAALLLAVVGFAVYSPSLSAPFIFDDDRTISLNPHVRQLVPADWLTKEPRPIAMLSFALNYRLTGLDIFALHVTNTAIHIAAAFMLFLLVREVLAKSRTNAKWIALAAAVLWLVHPLNTQAVSYLSQRFESLMGLFYLSTLYCLARSAGSQRIVWGVAAVIAAWLGAGCKEVMVTIVLVAPLFDRAYLADSWKTLLRQRGWIYALIAPIAPFLLLPRGGDATAGFGLESVTAWEYLRTQPSVILHYLGTAVAPWRLVFDYAWPVENDPQRIYLPGFIVLALVLGAVAIYVRKPAWGFPAIAFFLILAPTSSIMPIADLAVEHRMYLSTAAVVVGGLLLALAWLEQMIAAPSRRTMTASIAAVSLVALLGARTYVRNDDYRRPLRLFLQCVAFNAKNRRANNNVAVLLQQQQRIGEAKRFYQAAIDAAPNHGYAYRQMGMIAVEDKNLTEAAEWFRGAIKAEPYDVTGHYYLGLTLGRLGEDPEAANEFATALKLAPDFAPAMRETAWLLATSANDDLRDGVVALDWASKAAKHRPNDPRVLSALAAAFAECGQWEDAVEAANRAQDAAKEQKRRDLADFSEYVATFSRSEPFRRTAGEPRE